MSSDVEIVNLALTKLGASRIMALTDENDSARAANAIYAQVRDAELMAHPWNFAIRRASLAASATAPAFEYDKQFPVPSDFLRLYEIFDYPVQFPTEDPYFAIESHSDDGLVILTNEASPLKIRYVAKITDEAKYDPLFVQAFACSLALTLCDRKTEHQGKKQMIGQEYDMWLKKAIRTDAIQNPPIPYPESSWINSRY